MTDSKTVEAVALTILSAKLRGKDETGQAESAITALKSLGYLSPADVEAACVAAQREAFENAAKVAHKYPGGIAADIENKIRALSPSPGPFKRVPEGWTVARLKPTAEMIEAGVDAHYPGDEVVYPDEWETPDQAVIASYRAMIAAGGNP